MVLTGAPQVVNTPVVVNAPQRVTAHYVPSVPTLPLQNVVPAYQPVQSQVVTNGFPNASIVRYA